MRPPPAFAFALLFLLLPLVACSGSGDDASSASTPSPSQSPSQSSSQSSSQASSQAAAPSESPTTATAAPRPDDHACYRLDYGAAIAPTSSAKTVSCKQTHTATTYAVGTIDAVVDHHLLAVDSSEVQQQVASQCPRQLPGFLGGSLESRRLSMLRAVWFTPTVEESDAGADWYRCDVIAVASENSLARLSGTLRGVLDRPGDAARYGMCGTAEPGTSGFARVICTRDHAWRAISTVTFAGASYPGVDRARQAGQGPCEDAARSRASDALNFKWSYEWPTAQQWKAGQTYGLCWIPD